MTHESFQNFFQVENFWLAIYQSNHVDAKNRLQLCLGVKVIEHNVSDLTTTELDNNPQAILVRFVPQFSNTFDFLLFYQFGNALNQLRLV